VLAARSIDVRHGAAEPNALSQVSIVLTPGELVCVVGPNGSGKSTLVHTLSRTLEPASGVVCLDQADLYKSISARDAARSIGVVPQTTNVFLDFTVRDTIAMGRAPWRATRGMLAPDSTEDEAAVDRAIAQMEIPAVLAARPISRVSGGEQQRALVARMLAQEARVMLLDEPTAALDLAAQARLLDWLRRQAKHEGRAVMVVLHDLNHAAAYSDRLVVMQAGRVVADGPPEQVLTAQTVLDVYGVRAWIRPHPITDRPTVWQIPEPAPDLDGSALSGRAIHLMCGSGTGANIMFQLLQFGARVSASILHGGDDDAEAALSLGIPFAPVEPFSYPSPDAEETQAKLAAIADGAILTHVPIGPTNAILVDSAIAFAASGRPLVVVRGNSGRAEMETRIQRAGAVSFAPTDKEALSQLNEALSGGKSV
jgi:iron complex transport system ATP-binding protein